MSKIFPEIQEQIALIEWIAWDHPELAATILSSGLIDFIEKGRREQLEKILFRAKFPYRREEGVKK